ncbi:DUF4328 domain-containing protein [Microvirga sp. STR05]|uniref:DUF4328 domain-containing protein n=1 Tax=Hymenobacter duratus TaxID=2771356 RepID=A0ABR8JDU3_9BACT|nr:DUF4328 domain-containing protein [Hymenobacter duratus]MBD2715012.1 DUF4328 domain-containing protein [Hymenobacter duratus]MBR7949918.1 DUF4328 domain-containing protein [Microvirga sp. STR05]
MLGTSEPDSTTIEGMAALVNMLSITELGVTILSAIAFIRWMRRAYYNLGALGVGMEYVDSWAVSAWIVPIVSLHRPYTIMREIWQKTQRMAYGEVTSHHLLRLWWALFLLHSCTGLITSAVARQTTTYEGLRAQLLLMAGLSLIDLLGVVAVIQVIRRVTDFEQQLQLQAQVLHLGGTAPEALNPGATAEELYA